MMEDEGIVYSVFTKPWKEQEIERLGEHVRALGFDGVELPVRPGYQVEPSTVGRQLPDAVRRLADAGVQVCSIAGPTDQETISACAEAGVPTIRICVSVSGGYLEAENRLRREYEALLPLLEKYGVRIGVQNHMGRDIANALAVRNLIGEYDPRYFGIVWDAAHEALAGTEPDLALDIAWSHLCMVNLKNGYWQRVNGPEAAYAQWRVYWTGGRHGLAVWPRITQELEQRRYQGVICLTAEYSDRGAVDRLIAEDLNFAKSLFGRVEA